MTTTRQCKKERLASIGGIILSGMVLMVGLSCSNRKAAQVLELERQAAGLKSEMFGNIRQGLSGLGLQDGVPLLGSNERIQKYWGAAQQQGQQLVALQSQTEALQPSQKADVTLSWTMVELEDGREARNRMESILSHHSVLSEAEARVVASFMINANSLAWDVGQERPFSQFGK